MKRMLQARIGLGYRFDHASAERGREASWYAFQRKALERGGVKGTAEIETEPSCGRKASKKHSRAGAHPPVRGRITGRFYDILK